MSRLKSVKRLKKMWPRISQKTRKRTRVRRKQKMPRKRKAVEEVAVEEESVEGESVEEVAVEEEADEEEAVEEVAVEEESVEEVAVEGESVEGEADEEEDEVAAQFRLTMQEWAERAEQEETRRPHFSKDPELPRCQMLKDRASRTDWSKWQNWQ